MRPKQRAVERPESPAAFRGASWQHALNGLLLGLAEAAILTVVVVELKAVVPVEALASRRSPWGGVSPGALHRGRPVDVRFGPAIVGAK